MSTLKIDSTRSMWQRPFHPAFNMLCREGSSARLGPVAYASIAFPCTLRRVAIAVCPFCSDSGMAAHLDKISLRLKLRLKAEAEAEALEAEAEAEAEAAVAAAAGSKAGAEA